MSRRPRRDFGLSVRMAVALAFLAAGYGAIAVGVVLLFRLVPQWWPYWLALVVALTAAFVAHSRAPERLVLRSAGARVVSPRDYPHLHAQLERLAALAGIATPALAVAETSAANAFAVGVTPRRGIVAVTTGLLERLTPREREAVLAHEVTHLVDRDALVMTAVAVPRTLGVLLIGGGGSDLASLVWLVVWPLGIPLWALGSLLTLTVSRYREFVADRGSALLTGAPEQLASALQKLADTARIPAADLRSLEAANAFLIVGAPSRFTVFADHPPLEKRLEALAELARELAR